jgi:hypothetical protein
MAAREARRPPSTRACAVQLFDETLGTGVANLDAAVPAAFGRLGDAACDGRVGSIVRLTTNVPRSDCGPTPKSMVPLFSASR